MELKRSCSPVRLVAATVILVALMIASSWGDFIAGSGFRYQHTMGAVNILHFILSFDRFKVLMVLVLSGLHTASFCADINSHFSRMLFMRTDAAVYTQCRFLANGIAILISCGLSFFLFVFSLLSLYPVISAEAASAAFYYVDIAVDAPFLYVGMMALQFGMITAACSSIGLCFSAWQPNAFVSIGVSGLVFFIAISYFPLGTPFDILNMMSMLPILGREFPWYTNFAWGMLLPSATAGLSGLCFYGRLKWRLSHGYI